MIGVVLMVAITVVLAGAIFVLVQNLTKESHMPLPELNLATTDNGATYYVQEAPQGLPYADLKITGCTGIPTGPNVSAGDSWTTCSGVLTVVHKPTNTVIYRSN